MTATRENLNYTTEKRLLEVFGSRIKPENAKEYLRNPQKLANYVYGKTFKVGRDLGNTQPNDGYYFRGGGLGQLTGRDNYHNFQQKTGVPVMSNPDLITEPRNAVWSFFVFWNDRNLNALADKDDILLVTRKVNGGLNGLADRKVYLNLLNNAA